MKTTTNMNPTMKTPEPIPPTPPVSDKPTLPDNPNFRPFLILRSNGWSLGRISQKLGVPKSTLHRWHLDYQAELYWFQFARMEQIQDQHIPSYENQLQKLGHYLERIEAALQARDFNGMTTANLLNMAVKLRGTFNKLRKELPLQTPPLNTPLEPFPYTACISRLEEPSPDPMASLPEELSAGACLPSESSDNVIPLPRDENAESESSHTLYSNGLHSARQANRPTPPMQNPSSFVSSTDAQRGDSPRDENPKSQSSHASNGNHLHRSDPEDRPTPASGKASERTKVPASHPSPTDRAPHSSSPPQRPLRRLPIRGSAPVRPRAKPCAPAPEAPPPCNPSPSPLSSEVQ